MPTNEPEASALPLTRRQLRELAARQQAVQDVAEETVPEDAAGFEAPLKAAELATGAIPVVTDAAAEDPFEAAARALNFTGEASVRRSAARPQAKRATSHVAPKRRGMRGIATAAVSVGAMGGIVLLAFGMTTPLGATASGAEQSMTVTASADQSLPKDEIQAFVVSSDVANAEVQRADGYSASALFQVGDASGINTAGAFYENDISADIQYPIAVGTGMSSGYGYRWGALHEGIDLTPGEGAPVQAVADGVVRVATEAGGAYGVNVYIDHIIDGELVTTHYAHMEYGSLLVEAGDVVHVGQQIGSVGNTGRSYGAHLHFEVIIDGSTIDPAPWLEANANRHYSEEEQEEAAAGLKELEDGEIASQ
ncbi:MAG: M23 family metallopeptidase [Microbacterium sp.]